MIGGVYSGFYQNQFGEFMPYDRAYFWSNSVLTELGTLGGWSSDASGLNNSNVVIGMADDADQVSRPFGRCSNSTAILPTDICI